MDMCGLRWAEEDMRVGESSRSVMMAGAGSVLNSRQRGAKDRTGDESEMEDVSAWRESRVF